MHFLVSMFVRFLSFNIALNSLQVRLCTETSSPVFGEIFLYIRFAGWVFWLLWPIEMIRFLLMMKLKCLQRKPSDQSTKERAVSSRRLKNNLFTGNAVKFKYFNGHSIPLIHFFVNNFFYSVGRNHRSTARTR